MTEVSHSSLRPVVFLSHSSGDKEALRLLKQLLNEKLGGTIDIFLSSDGQSIPLGRNWVHRIEEALTGAKLLIMFMTQNSISSSWVSFEAGFAYAKAVRVVPVGFLGLDIANLPPPLGLLQGFNIKSEDGLDNLIALINEVFGHQHKSRFTAKEYDTLISAAGLQDVHASAFVNVVDEVNLDIAKSKEWTFNTDPSEVKKVADKIAQLIYPNATVWHNEDSAGLNYPGGRIRINRMNASGMVLDSLALDNYAKNIHEVARVINGNAANYSISLRFVSGLSGRHDRHKISALAPELEQGKDRLTFRGLRFWLTNSSESGLRMYVEHEKKTFPMSELRDLVQLLVDRHIVWKDNFDWM